MRPVMVRLAVGGAAFGAAASVGLNAVSDDKSGLTPALKVAIPGGAATLGAAMYGIARDSTIFKGPNSFGKGFPLAIGALAGAAAAQAVTAAVD